MSSSARARLRLVSCLTSLIASLIAYLIAYLIASRIRYVILASSALIALYIEKPDGTGVVSYVPISGTHLFLQCQAAALPPISLAVQLHAKWLNRLERAARRAVKGHDDTYARLGLRVWVPKGVGRKGVYRALLRRGPRVSSPSLPLRAGSAPSSARAHGRRAMWARCRCSGSR
jgi:hypothetical protein